MPVNDTIPVNMAASAYQPIPVHFVNVAIWNTKALTVNEVK